MVEPLYKRALVLWEKEAHIAEEVVYIFCIAVTTSTLTMEMMRSTKRS